MNIWTVYILYSASRDRYYVGVTDDVTRRLREHNHGLSSYTKGGAPWYIVHVEECESISSAYRRERFIKAKRSRKILECIVRSPDVRLSDASVGTSPAQSGSRSRSASGLSGRALA
ncbi:MAG: GIY-YIG nuclease family protein [Candidatus Uhrbacteria bacterium]